jgi:hypothetical protein
MKIFLLGVVGLLLTSAGVALQAAGFAARPSAGREQDDVLITFALDAPGDVAVSILDAAGKTVRHLGAGLLGTGVPPPPFQPGLQQRVAWDGRDDAGRPVAAGSYRARVQIGLTVGADKMVGDARQCINAVNALAVGPQGELYVYDGGRIAVLDRNGKYVREIKPFPSSLALDRLAGLDPVRLSDGALLLRRGYPEAKFTDSTIGSMAVSADGRTLFMPGPPRYARALVRIGTDGSVPADMAATRLTTHADNGFLYLACAPDGRTLYMAGAQAGYMGDDARELSFRQAVYRLRLDSTGPAEIFTGDDENRGDDGFSVNKPKGLAVDPAGRLYVCNQNGDNVAVYTPGAGFVRSYKIRRPQQVAVHPTSGRLYVLCGSESSLYKNSYHYPDMMHNARLVQLSAEGAVEKEMILDAPFARKRKDPTSGAFVTNAEFTVRMAVDFSIPARPVVWLGTAYPQGSFAKWRLLRIEDQGERFGEAKEVSDGHPAGVRGSMNRMALDRDRDILYLLGGSLRLERYAGDGTPMEPLRIVQADGQKPDINIVEPAVGPDGMIYFSAYKGDYGYDDNSIHRATPDGRLVPFEAGDVRFTHAMKGGSYVSSRGFAVSRRGEMYVMYYDDRDRPADKLPPEAWDRFLPLPTSVAMYAADGKLVDPRRIHYLRSGAECVRVDSRGGIYVADNFMPAGVSYPADIARVMPDNPLQRPYPARLADATFDPLLRWMGCVLKFGPAGGRVIGLPEGQNQPAPPSATNSDVYRPAPATQWFMFNYHHLGVTGAEWQFHGIAPIPAQYQGVTHVERCVCTGARFDVDAFDRVFVPDTFRNRFTVLDASGNIICHFGRYGNRDDDGLALGQAAHIVTDDDYAFIGDAGNRRLVRARLDYAAQDTCVIEYAAGRAPR